MKRSLIILLAVALLASIANAAVVTVNSNISVSTTWTPDNVYKLVGQIYVLPGATLTIKAGTLVQSALPTLAVWLYAAARKSTPTAQSQAPSL